MEKEKGKKNIDWNNEGGQIERNNSSEEGRNRKKEGTIVRRENKERRTKEFSWYYKVFKIEHNQYSIKTHTHKHSYIKMREILFPIIFPSNLKWILKPDLDPFQISLSNSSRNNQQNDSKSLSWIMDNKFRCYSLADVCHGVILGMSSFSLGRRNHLLHTDSSGIASSLMQDCAPLWGSYYCLNNVRSHHSSPR